MCALGVVAGEMLLGARLERPKDVARACQSAQAQAVVEAYPDLPDLLRALLAADPALRPSADQVLAYVCFQEQL